MAQQLILNDQEHATVLAALRFYQLQRMGMTASLPPMIEDLASNGGQVKPLSAAAIDKLCEKVNFAGVPAAQIETPLGAVPLEQSEPKETEKASANAVVAFLLAHAQGRNVALDMKGVEFSLRILKDERAGQPYATWSRVAESKAGNISVHARNVEAIAKIAAERHSVIKAAFKSHDTISEPDVQKGQYTGPVVQVSESGMYFVQSIGRRKAIVHMQNQVDGKPNLGDNITINYHMGRGSIAAKERDRGHSQER